MVLVYLTTAWAFGIWLARQFDLPPIYPLMIGVVCLGGAWTFGEDKALRTFFLTGLFLGLGLFRFDLARPEDDATHILQYNDLGGQMTITGVVVDEPETLDRGLRILVEADQAAGKSVHGRVLATIPRQSEVQYGDTVQLFGVLRTPPEFDTFSYSDYLARQNVFSVMFNSNITILETSEGFSPYGSLLSLKDSARDYIQTSLPEPQASLLVGILLGDESGLSEQTRANFSRTGTSHVIAISGFNMAIIAQVIMGLLKQFLKPKYAAFGAILMIAFYTVFVGAGAAVLRAAIMSSLLIIAQTFHRRTFVPASLAAATLLMTAYDPWILWDIGFQLSLAAVLGMALFVNPLERGLRQGLEKIATQQTTQKIVSFFSESLIVTLAAQITTTPIILYYFGRLSVVSLLVNFLITPVQTPLLLFGAVGTIVGLIFPPLGDILLNITWLFLTWTVEVVDYFSRISWADTELSINGTTFGLIMLGFFALMWYRGVRPPWLEQVQGSWVARTLQVGGLLTIALLITQTWGQPDGKLHVTFLNVDNGNAVLIETPNGGTILVDGGEFPTRLMDQLGQQLPPRTRQIDLLILTAPQESNQKALLEVVERYEIGGLVTNGQESNNEVYLEILNQLTDIPQTTVTQGYEILTDDGVKIMVLNPATLPEKEAEPKLAGLVLRVEYEGATFLLSGESDADLESILLANPHLLQANVWQVADPSSIEFVQTVNPQAAIFQVSSDNAPSPTLIDRLSAAQIFRTDQDGMIEIITDGEQMQIYRE